MPIGNPDENISWEEPPAARPRRGSKWDPVAAALKANPGKWARVITDGNISVKTDATTGKLRCFQPAGSFEGRTANFTNRFTGDVYLRYVGENGEYR